MYKEDLYNNILETIFEYYKNDVFDANDLLNKIPYSQQWVLKCLTDLFKLNLLVLELDTKNKSENTNQKYRLNTTKVNIVKNELILSGIDINLLKANNFDI